MGSFPPNVFLFTGHFFPENVFRPSTDRPLKHGPESCLVEAVTRVAGPGNTKRDFGEFPATRINLLPVLYHMATVPGTVSEDPPGLEDVS